MTHYDDAKETFRCEHGKARGMGSCQRCEPAQSDPAIVKSSVTTQTIGSATETLSSQQVRLGDTVRPASETETVEHKRYGCDCKTCREWRQGIYNSGRWPRPRFYNGEEPSEAARPAVLPATEPDYRRCGHCQVWATKPCGEQCHWEPGGETVAQALSAVLSAVLPAQLTTNEGKDDAMREAAQDLLTALKDVVEMLQREAPGTLLNNHRFDALGIAARNAIAKAEGLLR